jgi:type IV fimbrial biogenesis protein FimT
MQRHAGFTLIELMVTVLLVSIIAGIAVPAVRDMMERNRLVAQTNELISILNLARSEAIRRRQPVSVCPDGTFTNGIEVRQSADCSSAGATVLHVQRFTGADSVTLDKAHVTYAGSGTLSTSETKINIKVGDKEKDMCIRLVGRVEGGVCGS